MENESPSAQSEFATIDLLRRSSAETRGVDAFALAVIKAERQVRRIFTYCVFQFPCFTSKDIKALRTALAQERVYFWGFEVGLNHLLPWSIPDLVGESHDVLRADLEDAMAYRNKIFHGQLTDRNLSREELFELALRIQRWCEALASGATTRFSYDGFAGRSFRKAGNQELWKSYRVEFREVPDYVKFMRERMLRR